MNPIPSSLCPKGERNDQQEGFIAIIILITIALVLLQSVFGVNIVGFFNSETFLNFLTQAKAIILSFWTAVSKVFGSK